MRHAAMAALATALLAAVPGVLLHDGIQTRAIAQQAGHQYVVGVSGMT